MEAITPPPAKPRTKKPAIAPETAEEILEGLPLELAKLNDRLNGDCRWKRKDDPWEMWVGRCPFPHDSGTSGDADLSCGLNQDGEPYLKCQHASCVESAVINDLLKSNWRRLQPLASREQESDPRADLQSAESNGNDRCPGAIPPALAADPRGPAPAARTAPESSVSDPDDDALPIRINPWPEPPRNEAFHGLLGDIVRTIEPHTEADPLALLATLLVFFGNAIGKTAYMTAEADRHYLNEFVVTVGKTSMGRKGVALGWAKHVFAQVDSDWLSHCFHHGLSSGEGLISAVRDPVETRSPIRQKGKIIDYQMTVSDPGVDDKRLLVEETEFGGPGALERDGNRLSSVIRDGWDGKDLKTLTKVPQKATGAHVSIVGHITIYELLQLLSRVDIANGFANRFLWFAVRRQKSLPFGGAPANLSALCDGLSLAVDDARLIDRIGWSDTARRLWPDIYNELFSLPPPPLAEVLSRGQPHVLRLASIYALADRQTLIDDCHLLAAKALWDSSVRCARYIFGDALPDPNAEKIRIALLAVAPNGLTRTEINHGLFKRHLTLDRLNAALALLIERGLAKELPETTAGRTAHRYFSLTDATKATNG